MISVIIPALNEKENIARLICKLKEKSAGYVSEIIVVDGGSRDDTRAIAAEAGAKVITSDVARRSTQMNAGAAAASSKLLYFLHADTIPPDKFDNKIIHAVSDTVKAGCFRLRFDDPNPFLRFYAWFTKFRGTVIRFGDQSLFICNKYFHQLGGFREDLFLMEDQEIISRIKSGTSFKILDDCVITSSRKYHANGVVRLQLIFTVIVLFYYLGMKQETLKHLYKYLIGNK